MQSPSALSLRRLVRAHVNSTRHAQCRLSLRRHLTTTSIKAKSSSYRLPPPPPGGRTLESLKPAWNTSLHPNKPIKTYPPPPSYRAKTKDPIAHMAKQQLALLDPSGARTRLFSTRTNPESAHVGDILLVRLKNGDPFAGVCLNIRQRGVDTGILLRNHVLRLPVEMWFKIYSPSIESIEVVQRREKRARRARLYYMRKPKHDIGSVDGIVQRYLRQKALLSSGDGRGREGGLHQWRVKGGKKR